MKFIRLVLAVTVAIVSVASLGAPAAASSHIEYVDIDIQGSSGLLVTRADGVVEARGNQTVHYGDRPALEAGERVVALATSTAGYWLFTDRGNVFAYGDAVHFGDVGHLQLAGPVIAAVPTASGLGYYMLGNDGGIFTFGDAVFRGSLPGLGVVPNEPVVSMSATGGGYVLIAADGGTFAFGSAGFHGSLPGLGVVPARPVIDLVPGTAGYLMLGADGGVFNFGASEFHGALVGYSVDDAVSVTVKDDLSGYLILTTAGNVFSFGRAALIGADLFTGTGDQVVLYPVNGPVIIESLMSTGDSNFSIWTIDSLNDRVDLVANTIGNVRQRRMTNRVPAVGFEVRADGDWIIAVQPMTYAAKWRPSSGSFSWIGEEVVMVAQSPGARIFHHESTRRDGGSDLLGGRQYTQPLTANDFGNLLINDFGGYTERTALLDITPDAWFLAVEADNTFWKVWLS